MNKIFFSYCTVDEEYVNNVFENIKLKNPELTIFKFNQTKYDSNQAWAEIDKNINEANVYFVFISKISLESKSVLAELYAALHKSINSKKNEFKIIPIIIDSYTCWENNSPFVNYPLLNSITRIEDFSRNYETLSKYIIDNLDKDQWPLYVPNIKFYGVLVNTEVYDYLSDTKKIKCKMLLFFSNIDLEKISFIYKTNLDFKHHRSNTGISTSGHFRFMNPVINNNETYNFLQVNNESIEKGELFRWNFEEKSFLKENDDILKIGIKVAKDKVYFIDIIYKLDIIMEELSSSSKLSEILNELQKKVME